MKLQLVNTDETYRSLLLDAVPMPEDELLGWQLRNGVFVFRFSWRRMNYWEADTQVGLEYDDLLGANNTGTAGTEKIYNSYKITAVTDEVLAAGDGSTLSFSGTLTNKPVIMYDSTLFPVITWTDVGDVNRTVTVGYDLVLTGSDAQYVDDFTLVTDTGAWTIKFFDGYEPKNATNVLIDYRYGYANFLTITGVTGDMPAPAILTIDNKNATEDMAEWWIGRQENSYNNIIPIYQGEAATVASTVADATCSGGNRGDYTTTSASEEEAFRWALSASGSPYNGETFLALARFTSAANTGDIENMYYRWKVATSGSPTTYLWVGEQMRPDTTLSRSVVPLGTIQLPPAYLVQPAVPLALADLSLSLFVQRVDGTNRVASIDYLLLMPTEGLCKLEALGTFAQLNGDILTMDPTQENLYNFRTGVGALPTFRKLYGTILLRPNVGQRIFFVCHENQNYLSSPFYKSNVTVSYRPRRRII